MLLPLGLAFIAALLYRFILFPLFFSPLRTIPRAHWSAPFAPIWILYTRWAGRELKTIHAKHKELGPVLLLGPNELSVNSVEGGLRTVYAGAWEKSEWYEFFANYDDVPNMFSTIASKPHSVRKRKLSAIYSKSTILSSPSLRAATAVILHQRLLPLLSSLAPSAADSHVSAPINLFPLLNATTMDFVTSYIFGLANSTNFIQDTRARDDFLAWYNCRRSYNFWPQEFPRLTGWLRTWLGIRLVPRFIDTANRNIERFTTAMCAKVRAASSDAAEDRPNVHALLSSAFLRDASSAKDDTYGAELSVEEETRVASELLDHLIAGFETSGITLIYLIHELSQRPALQAALRAELLGLATPLTPACAPDVPDAKALDAAPLLHAILMETLRLHAAIPGPEPRISPPGAALGPAGHVYANLPGGMRVASQAWSLHRNEDAFPDAERWLPERWLDSDGQVLCSESPDGGGERFREMMRWFWAFGSGGRMCIGSHLAVYQMKFIITAIYSNFETSIFSDAGIEQMDLYTAPPRSHEPLFITFKRV